MALTYRAQQLRHERAIDAQLTEAHRQLALAVSAVVSRYAGAARIVPNTRRGRDLLHRDIWEQAVRPFYIGSGQDAFNGTVPQSPYARLLFEGIQGSIEIAVRQQINIARRAVRDTAVWQWLTGERPFGEMTYDPFHRFVDPNGYTLSDRVWRVGIDVRARIDRLLDYHIANGTDAVRIADLLEDYLTPGAKLIRTRTPYGTEGSYAARRLARTEVTAAHGRATINASTVNPFVRGVQWVLSTQHGKADECDRNAHGGPDGDGVYQPQNVPQFPNHPHDKCHLAPVAVTRPGEVVANLRADMQSGLRLLQGIFNLRWMVGALLGGAFNDLMERIGV